ncbi:NAD(P)H-hydrate dehydratase [Parvularcula sp. ZS-1/3]|uniref:Bifunctional NAD(P)H-hydrate repair enzyme n=1 Tax=Parvularcula mediterranea TaxID=2732508 RepID=A0A7Y3RK62_9PROT|nr:NAD(P)H-hydrate dehydratase [Parvularcula mediterranea]NNU15490.1 NAD(P)H-hydrate dehydratase [Parvularcula mediterranea]
MGFEREAMQRQALLTPDAMQAADRRTIAGGTPVGTLVARAARAIFRILRAHYTRRPVTILCGPGQNGEDGLMLAALLDEAGWPVTLNLLDAGVMDESDTSSGLMRLLSPTGTFRPEAGTLVVDALFGAGLNRPIEGEARLLIEKLEASDASVLAVDLPSGIDGRTGEVLGAAAKADITVSFHRAKPGHFLGEGRRLSGRLFIADIGIVPHHDDTSALHNDPALWKQSLAVADGDTHKYARGHVAVVGGPGLKGGAARLAARAASVSGAGAVTYLAPLSGAEFAASQFDAVMVKPLTGPEELRTLIDGTASAIVIGPGMGHGRLASECLSAALESGLPCVLDADALTLYEDTPHVLFGKLHERCILTPHEGEFSRLFPGLDGDRLSRAKKASARAGAMVLLKGSTTAIAGGILPVLNTNGSAALATAGSGDTLAGLIGGFMARGIAPEVAAAAAAWVHAEAAQGAGPGFNADQLAPRIAAVLERLASS